MAKIFPDGGYDFTPDSGSLTVATYRGEDIAYNMHMQFRSGHTVISGRPDSREPTQHAYLRFWGYDFGTVSYDPPGGSNIVEMKDYLIKGPSRQSTERRWKGRDGCIYQWSLRELPIGPHWTCHNLSEGNEEVATHNPVDQAYCYSTPEMIPSNEYTMWINKEYIDMSVELLATLTIMRHIRQYRLY